MVGWATHLLILACMVAAFLPAFLVGCLEWHPVRMFESGPIHRMTAYLMNALLRAQQFNHFQLRAYGHHFKHKGGLFGALLLSADRQILAVAADGVIYRGFRTAATLLFTRFRDGSVLITTDSIGTGEMDQMTKRQIVWNATFDELLEKHKAAAEQRIGADPFPADADWETLEEIYRARAQRLVARGLARYADPQRQYIRYTLSGSLRMTVIHGLTVLHRPATYLRSLRFWRNPKLKVSTRKRPAETEVEPQE
jgi:hypothetical protein